MSDLAVGLERHSRQSISSESCESEQIHIPGCVQTFGCVVAFDSEFVITRISENAEKFLNVCPRSAVGSPLSKLLEDSQLDFVKSAILTGQRTSVRIAVKNGIEIHAIVRLLDDENYLDVLEHSPNFDFMLEIQKFVTALSAVTNHQDCANVIAHQIRRTTNFDRVKIYKFDSDWHGEVIAESRDEEMVSYLGHHFPESDIPVQARELYIRNRVRVIANVDDPQAEIIQKRGLKPLNLSFSFIRSVSLTHIQYLKNMDVAASMSIAIFERNRLWGLIVCHHRTPRSFNFEEATFFQTVSDLCSSRLSELICVEEANEDKRSLQLLQKLIKEPKDNMIEGLIGENGILLDLVPSVGVAVCLNGVVHSKQNTPDDARLRVLVEWLERGPEPVFHCEDLPARFGESIDSQACGLLAVKIPNTFRSWILWFRQELIHDIHWAGDPGQSKAPDGTSTNIGPRSSFASWKEKKRGRSAPWKNSEILSASTLISLVSVYTK